MSCIKVLIQVSTIFWMRTCWFWFLQRAKMLHHSSSVVKCDHLFSDLMHLIRENSLFRNKVEQTNTLM